MPTRKKNTALSERDKRLRELGRQRLEKLREQEERIRRHLESDRGKNDYQALRYLLHQVEVERHDLFNNLKIEDYVPKPGRARRGKRAISLYEPPPSPKEEEGPAPQPSKYNIPRPVPGQSLPSFLKKYTQHEERDSAAQSGRSWTSAPYVEVQLPVKGTDKIIAALRRFSEEGVRFVVRGWARKTFGSIQEARDALLRDAKLEGTISDWRELLELTKSAKEFRLLSDDKIQEAMSDSATGAALRIRRAALLAHCKSWSDRIVRSIKDSAPKGTHKDTLDRLVRPKLQGFHAAVNSGKHTNPQFPYLKNDRETVDLESVITQVLSFLDYPDKERYVKDKEDSKKRMHVTVLQEELGKASPRKRLELRRHKWAGKPYFQGTILRRREASLVWDTKEEVNGLALALHIKGFQPIDVKRYIYQDGTSLLSDFQLVANKKDRRGKACAVLKLKPKHDFLRWYSKHIENHNAGAPPERRCIHNTTQFVVVDPDGSKPRLFIRPAFKFYEPNKRVPDCHSPWKKPECRYLIGIDRGINYVLRAVVVDTEQKKVIQDIALEGKKREWKKIRDEIAYHQRMRDYALNQKAHPSVVAKHARALALARKKGRALGKFETVEAVTKLVDLCERDYGSGNYCFVLEDLEVHSMNLGRNNRVKHMAAVSDALVNQMRKRGYAYNSSTGKVDGVRYEGAWYTSQVSPFGWWAKRGEVEKAWKQDKARPIGRRVGQYYERPIEEGDVAPELFRKGHWKRPVGPNGKAKGKPKFCLEPSDALPTAPIRHTIAAKNNSFCKTDKDGLRPTHRKKFRIPSRPSVRLMTVWMSIRGVSPTITTSPGRTSGLNSASAFFRYREKSTGIRTTSPFGCTRTIETRVAGPRRVNPPARASASEMRGCMSSGNM